MEVYNQQTNKNMVKRKKKKLYKNMIFFKQNTTKFTDMLSYPNQTKSHQC